MQCKNLIVLATVAIMALTSTTFAKPTEEGMANPSLQKRGLGTAIAGAYLTNKALKKGGVNGVARGVGTLAGGWGINKILG
ncbi:hypothetical protein IWQ62_006066, partial [Dispira parvispora]